MIETKQSILKRYFGYDAFRDGQETLIEAILDGRDVLGVMPTGAGKSVCFQVPALLMQGITLVISPLISLMKDQVNTLTQAGVHGAYLNSSLSASQYARALANAARGDYQIIYVAPERLLAPEFWAFAQNAPIAMVTVDEAHCISSWGQDFRPSYLKITEFVEALPHRPVVSAFTATATAQVREDVVAALHLNKPKVLVTGFDRPNLYFEVQKPAYKKTALLAFLQDKREKSGIVYCATRKAVEEVCAFLLEEGFGATRYHAGLSDKERRDNQDDFIFDRAAVMVATNAFGMGIDKSDVAFVVHYQMPKNLESYYQEAGRAGRDGGPADCLLLYSGQDVRTNQYLIEHGDGAVYEDEETKRRVQERDLLRLREMTFYCHSSDCLRGYIMRYFGEETEPYCGNCGNCRTVFEEVEVTAAAQAVLRGVLALGGRFGGKMVTDLLRGSKNERLLKLGLDRLEAYGSCKLSENRLRSVIRHLTMNGFLETKAEGVYSVLRLGERAGEILEEGRAVLLKLPKEEAAQARPSKKSGSREISPGLFGRLRTLRTQIAKELGVPAYVVFSDSTLGDMCVKKPATEAELLEVSGVGQVKLARFGARFLEAIAQGAQSAAEKEE